MKTAVIIFVVILFVITLFCYFRNSKNNECGLSDEPVDKRAETIRRAKKNLHPKININVDRCTLTGRYIKK